MVTSKKTLEVIKEIIERNYKTLMISVLGRTAFSETELEQLKSLGIKIPDEQSLLALAYYHNFINHPTEVESPQTVEEMKQQQSVTGMVPEGQASEYTVQNINDKTRQLMEKLKLDAITRIDGIIRENNDAYKNDALQNLDRNESIDELVKESTLGKVKQTLRDSAKEANRDWTRIALTEVSNAVGIASVDRIVADNRDSDLDEIYVYRISVRDAKTCRWCRKFYNDTDGSPKLYKLSTLLSNGSNYGKKTDSWMPVAGATHPNERCSQTLELKPGWKLQAGGTVTYIGLDGWKDYIAEKLSA